MATPSTTDLRSDEVIQEQLGDLAAEIARVETKRDELYAARLAFWRRAIELGWTQARLAEASRTSEGAVTQALRRARLSER